MENSLDNSNIFLNPQQPLKVDDKQNSLANILVISSVDSPIQGSGSGLSYSDRATVDKWMSQQSTNYLSPIEKYKNSQSLEQGSVVNVFKPEPTTPKLYFAPLAITVTRLPVVVKTPADIAPTGLVVNGVKSSYDMGSTLSIDPSFVVDGDGWKDVSKVDFWLTDAKGKRVELPDATSFVAKDLKDKNTAKFSYSTSLKGYTAGDYKLNAIAYDKFGAASNQFTQSIAIKALNVAPTSPVITGIKSSYASNSILSIDSGYVTDPNGWQDVSKVDFYLTNAQGKRVELVDASSFTIRDTNSAKFSYTTSLSGIAPGEYKLNAVSIDKAGLVSNPFTQSLTIKPVNIAPTAPVITGIKSSYDANSTLSIDSGLASDSNGWQDISKVDFYLTNAQGIRTELADATTFTAQDAKTAKFSYSASLNGIAAGDYKLNAVAYDKAGVAGNPFAQSIAIKAVYQTGFDNGTNKIDASILDVFTKLNGVQILGKAIENVRVVSGGKVQSFEKGSIFQSTAGTFALQGTLNNSYNALSAADKLRLGMPTANETNVGGYWHQSFQNGELQLGQGMPVKWSDLTLITDRFNLLGGANILGKAVGSIRDLNGGKVQDYEKGSIFAYGNKTVAVTGSIAAYYQANSATLGLPTGEESTTSYGKRQDFQGAAVMSSVQFGVHTLQGSLVGYYTGLTAAQKDQLGAATT